MNPVNRTYHEHRYNHKLGKFMDTYEWENEFLKLDDNFMAIRYLMDLYESFNNIPTALRRQSPGISNFEFARNRILWAIRNDAPINVVPLSNSKIHKVGKKR
ncbi:MAG: hypothetical protein MR210_01210 [Erysipelotrichaceae bacterium]|nr:hypothetical protein [Erysipelotrichaceae bacterium]MDY5251489.1 hypothetical protein [Erysipelotrichaceae bacterium]